MIKFDFGQAMERACAEFQEEVNQVDPEKGLADLLAGFPMWASCGVYVTKRGWVILRDPNGVNWKFSPDHARALAEILWQQAEKADG